MTNEQYFIRETHGIHLGTGKDHVKHGIDDAEEIIQLAIQRGYPDITFVIHTPRLTRFRYNSERATDIKFIRGDRAYTEYPARIENLRNKYGSSINIRYGIELEWLGSGLGLQWNRSKIFQAGNPDFIIGSVHFSAEGIPYDGSKEEAEELLKIRGGLENYWDGYLLEIMEMIDASHDLIQVIGHLDLPKLYMPVPDQILNIETSSHFLARRMRTLLELISEYNLALDVNLAGIKKNCGIYPGKEILSRASRLHIPVSIGTDTHNLADYGVNFKEGAEYLSSCGYNHYVYFSRFLPSKQPLINDPAEEEKYKTLNTAIGLLNQRFNESERNQIPNLSFGGIYKSLVNNFPKSTGLGNYEAIRVRKGSRSLTIGNRPENKREESKKLLYSLHSDKPGTLSILLNTLASEEINVDTAYLDSNNDGTATALLSLSGSDEMINNAVEFVKGTASDKFFTLEYSDKYNPPAYKKNNLYLLEVDGVDLPIELSRQMILSVHNDSPGVLLILLSALASRNININAMQLGRRGNKGFAILGVEGDENGIKDILGRLGSEYHEVSYLLL